MSGPAAPFSLGEGDDACLLLHGLTGAPAEVRPVGEALARAGFRAVGPLLPGHGTSPQDLEAVTRSDMLDAAREALLSLRGARRLSRSLSGSAPVRVFPRSGHVLPLDVDGPAVCDAIVSFFQEG